MINSSNPIKPVAIKTSIYKLIAPAAYIGDDSQKESKKKAVASAPKPIPKGFSIDKLIKDR